LLKQAHKEMRGEVSRQEYKALEVRGYDKMLERIIASPMTASENH
jgi:hypothetical protein